MFPQQLGAQQVSVTQTLDISALMQMMIQMMMLVMVMKMMSGAMKEMA